MKLDGKTLIFRGAMPWPTRRRTIFLWSGNTVHLLETALVIEGYQQRFGLPIIDLLFRRALSEWTTVTIPYSRIVCYGFSRNIIGRVVVTTLLWSPFVILASILSVVEIMTALMLLATLPLPLAVITYYLFSGPFSPRNTLLYRRADGSKAILAFTIRDKRKQKEFTDRIRANLKVAQERGRP